MDDYKKAIIDGVVANAAYLSNFLVIFFLLSITVLLTKIFGGEEVDFRGVKIKTRYYGYLLLFVTIFHIYFSYIFRKSVYTATTSLGPKELEVLYTKLTNGGPILFNGFVARLQIVPTSYGTVFLMDQNDPTSWMVHGAAIVTFFSIVHIRNTSWPGRLWYFLIAICVVLSNWILGGGWAVTASCLSASELPVCRDVLAQINS